MNATIRHALGNFNSQHINKDFIANGSICPFTSFDVDEEGYLWWVFFSNRENFVLSESKLLALAKMISPNKKINIRLPNGDISVGIASALVFLEAFTNAVKYGKADILISNHMLAPVITMTNWVADKEQLDAEKEFRKSSGFGTKAFRDFIKPTRVVFDPDCYGVWVTNV